MKPWKYALVSILLFVCVSLLVLNPFKKEIWDSNYKLLKNEVLSKSVVDEKMKLSTFTPFEWDHSLFISTHILSKEAIYKTVRL